MSHGKCVFPTKYSRIQQILRNPNVSAIAIMQQLQNDCNEQQLKQIISSAVDRLFHQTPTNPIVNDIFNSFNKIDKNISDNS